MDGSRLPAPPRRHQPRLVRRILADPTAALDEIAERYGSMCGFGAGPMRLAVVGDPAALRELFALPADHFRWGHRYNVLGFVVGRESLIVSDGDDHARRRGSVQTAFSRRRLNGWIPTIVERTDRMIDQIVASLGGDAREIDLYPYGRALVLEIVVRSMFGERLASRATEIGELFERPQAYLESPAVRQLPHPFPGTARARVRRRSSTPGGASTPARWAPWRRRSEPARSLASRSSDGAQAGSTWVTTTQRCLPIIRSRRNPARSKVDSTPW